MGYMPEKDNVKAEFSNDFFLRGVLIHPFAEECKGEDIIIPVFSLGVFVMLCMLVYI